MADEISFEDFQRVEVRVGTVVDAQPFPEARKPAIKLWVEFGGALGVRKSSAQITKHYSPDRLIGRQVLAVVKRQNRPVSEVCHVFDPLPQILKNVRYKAGADPLSAEAVRAEIAAAEARLAELKAQAADAASRAEEIALFDLHNRAHDAGRSVLYTASEALDAIGLVLPDLRSRLAQSVHVSLPQLDDAGRHELLRLRADRRGLQLDPATIDWLLRRVDRDVPALTALLDRLDRASLASQRRLTVPFVRQVLADDDGRAGTR